LVFSDVMEQCLDALALRPNAPISGLSPTDPLATPVGFRLARLLASSFSRSSHGFAAIGEPNVAVCLLPGTEIAFDKEVKKMGFWLAKRTGQTTAVFRQLDKNIPSVFHDALEFADGQIVLLTRLKRGQRATVLQLPALPTASRGLTKEERTSVLA
jgi:hypothetical protein